MGGGASAPSTHDESLPPDLPIESVHQDGELPGDSVLSSFVYASDALRLAIQGAHSLDHLHQLALELVFEENLRLALHISEQQMKPQQPPATQLELGMLRQPTQLDLDASCSICLCDWEEEEGSSREERACQMPGCGHVFHRDCIVQWLDLCNSCPVCRLPLQSEDVEEQRPDTPDSPPSVRPGSPHRVLAELLSSVSSSDSESEEERTELQLEQRAALQGTRDWQLPPIGPPPAAASLDRASLRGVPARGYIQSRQARRAMGMQLAGHEHQPHHTIQSSRRAMRVAAAPLELPLLGRANNTFPQPSFGGINNSEARSGQQLEAEATEEHRKRNARSPLPRNARSPLPPIAAQRNTSR